MQSNLLAQSKQWLIPAYYYATLPLRYLASSLANQTGMQPIATLFYHRVADDALAEHVSLLDHRNDLPAFMAFAGFMRDRLMEVRVEHLSFRLVVIVVIVSDINFGGLFRLHAKFNDAIE